MTFTIKLRWVNSPRFVKLNRTWAAVALRKFPHPRTSRSHRWKCWLSNSPFALHGTVRLGDFSTEFSFLEIDSHFHIVPMTPADCCHFSSWKTVFLHVALAPFLAIPDHFHDVVQMDHENTNANSVIIHYIAGTCHSSTGDHHFRGSHSASVPAFLVIKAFLGAFHLIILIVETKTCEYVYASIEMQLLCNFQLTVWMAFSSSWMKCM